MTPTLLNLTLALWTVNLIVSVANGYSWTYIGLVVAAWVATFIWRNLVSWQIHHEIDTFLPPGSPD